MSKNIAVILSGCGFMDGTEIHEAVLTLLHLTNHKATYQCFAPNIEQTTVTNHVTREKSPTSRNVLEESARIARCNIKPLSELKTDAFDGIIFPGGLGASINLCQFGIEGPECSVDPEIEQVINVFYKQNKPIGAICIAPALIARVLGKHNIEVTIGTDINTATHIEKTGAKHINKEVTQFHCDEKNKIITTPAYMLGKNISEVSVGIEGLVKKLISICS